MALGTLISLGVYGLLMLSIGFYAMRNASASTSEFMLGGRRLGPGVTSLSAGASDMSGWLMMGVPGAAFLNGISSSWIALGLVIGAWLNYRIVAPRLRVYTELAGDALTIPDYLEKRFADRSHRLRFMSSLVIVLFFILYTSSGLVAGGKLFESAFGLSYQWGMWITASVVVIYTYAGGFTAVSQTDFVQGTIVFIALVMVPIVAFSELDSLSATQLTEINPNMLSMTSGMSVIAVISSMAWGLGYFGQPHIIVRFMAIRSVRDLSTARHIGISWMTISLLGAVATGMTGLLYSRKYGIEINDAETIFIILSQVLFHPLVGGFMLAAILAAIMSTISSQLLVSSSSLTEDFYRLFVRRHASQTEYVAIGRLSVVFVALIAVLLARNPDSSVLDLVSHAWAGFGAALGPVIIMSLYWPRMTVIGAITGMFMGAITVLIWTYAPLLPPYEYGNEICTLNSILYSIVPGFIVCALSAWCVSLCTKHNVEVEAVFRSLKKRLTAAF